MAAISNQQSVASSVLPQVNYVRIPDPDCKGPLSTCEHVMIPVDEQSLQSELWRWDHNHNGVLSADDIAGDPAMTVPNLAANRLAQLVVGSQYIVGSKTAFKSIDALLNVVRTTLAIDHAYTTVQWLNALPSKHINSSSISNEIEFNTGDWEKIVGRLGESGIGYTSQVNQASRLFQTGISQIPGVQYKKFDHGECFKDDCTTYGVAIFIDPSAAPYGLQGLVTDWSRKMAAIYDFALNAEIECEGWNCPSQSESPQPYETVTHRGLLIGLRQDQGTDTQQSYLAFNTHFGWSDPQVMWTLLDLWLVEKSRGNIATVAAK